MADTHHAAKVTVSSRGTREATIKDEIEVVSCDCILLVYELARLQLKNVRVLNDVLKPVQAQFAKEWMVQSYFVEC